MIFRLSARTTLAPEIIRGKIWIVALRDIEKGEELTSNYGWDLDGYEDHPCRCGAENCIGYIVAEENFAKLRRRLAYKKKTSKKVR